MKLNEIKLVVEKVVRENLDITASEYKEDKPLIEMGADSLDLVEICLGVEDELAVNLDDQDMDKVRTAGDVVKLVNAMIGDPADDARNRELKHFGQMLVLKGILNINQRGTQDIETLLIALTEEVGELAQAYLEHKHDGGNRHRIFSEAVDAGAVILAIMYLQHIKSKPQEKVDLWSKDEAGHAVEVFRDEESLAFFERFIGDR